MVGQKVKKIKKVKNEIIDDNLKKEWENYNQNREKLLKNAVFHDYVDKTVKKNTMVP